MGVEVGRSIKSLSLWAKTSLGLPETQQIYFCLILYKSLTIFIQATPECFVLMFRLEPVIIIDLLFVISQFIPCTFYRST